ncbi:MAG: UDP-N-acetylmuramoyl-L-alanine--D-glutamate ligase [Chloroflexi bacterium]|nr:UDP-N-acetylmuramoyl-L-alanine--D-glutamate ligase [Chloroflexota bacterium]
MGNVGHDVRSKRVTLVGLGTRAGGLGVARYLAQEGAEVTVTDLRPREALTEPLTQLAGLPIRYVLGGHEERDFTPERADLIVRNPGVPRRAPLLELARSHGIPIEMEMSLFFRACPSPIIGVTGTKGKTTVSTLIGELLRSTFPEIVVAGNMGISALDQLPRLCHDVPVVIELSSWQLEALIEHGLSPRVAVLTLIAEDHLNTYDGFADYAATKRGIVRHQRPGDWLVVNRDDSEAWRAAAQTAATVVPFGEGDRGHDGAWLADGLLWRWQGAETHWPLPTSPALAGRHGARNALAALAAAMVTGANAEAISNGLAAFRGVRDRMEMVAVIDGVMFINDTTATAPIAAVAALDALSRRRGQVHLLAGGADKRLDPSPLAEAAVRHDARVYLFTGTATPALYTALESQGVTPRGPFAGMADAVKAAWEAAAPGDVIVLSPGCASFGLFRDEFDRGDRFREAVMALHAEIVQRGTDVAG